MRKIIGVTGNMGTGKSTLSKELAKHCELNIIELDDLRRYALWESLEDRHIALRKSLGQLFNLQIKDTWLNREKFTEIIFSSPERLSSYSKCATPLLHYDTELKIKDTTLNTLVVWAWLLEEKYYKFLNSFVILTSCDEERLNKELNLKDLVQRRSLEPIYSSRLEFKKYIEIFEFNNNNLINLDSVKLLVNKING